MLLPEAVQAQNSSSPTSVQRGQGAPGSAARASDPKSAGQAGGKTGKPSLPGSRPLASLLGMTLQEATNAFGAPVDVFPLRGHHAWEDDVVFYYADHSYLFWFRNRVWEVRVDRRFTGTALGVKMGESKAQVQKVLGKPFHIGKSSEMFILPNRGFPVRARLFFSKGRLSDLYVYRADF